LGQIHAALSYYYDHQQAFDATIEEQLREVEALRAQAGESPIRQRLRALGKLP
jgi:type II secretory pathway component PulM